MKDKRVWIRKMDGGFFIECETELTGIYDEHIRHTLQGAFCVAENYFNPHKPKAKKKAKAKKAK